MHRLSLDAAMCAAVVATVLSLVLARGARADMYLDLVAAPGAGYTVLDDGKTVQLDQASVGSIDFQFSVVFPDYRPDDVTGLYQTIGVFLSRQTDGGSLSSGTLTNTNTPEFMEAVVSKHGRPQDLNADGLGDVGPVGSGSIGGVWTHVGPTQDYVWADQAPMPLGTPPNHPGTQIISNLVLTGLVANPAPSATSRTEYGYVPRVVGFNHVWVEFYEATNGIPPVSAPVAILPYTPGMWTGNGGAGNARWDVAANWAGGGVPTDIPVSFGPTASNGNTIELGGDRSATSLTCSNFDDLTFTGGTLSVTAIRKITRGGSVTFTDTVLVNVAEGATIENSGPAGQLLFNGGVTLQGAGVRFTGSQPIVLGGSLDDNGYGLTVDGSLSTSNAIHAAWLDGAGSTTLQPGAQLLAGRVRQAQLNIGSGAAVTVLATAAPNVATSTSRLASLAIDGGVAPAGTLDLNNNSLIVDYTGPLGTILSDVTAQIRSGRNGVDANDQANWNGPGIITTAGRAANAAAKIDLYNLGAISNADLDAAIIGAHYTTFAGQAVAPNAVLVKYTYNGDANLDGVADADDYSYWLNGFLGLTDASVRGWLRGDFNYDGRVDAEDYTLWLDSFLFNGVPLGGISPTPVPEPATALLFAPAAFGLMLYARRARRVGQGR